MTMVNVLAVRALYQVRGQQIAVERRDAQGIVETWAISIGELVPAAQSLGSFFAWYYTLAGQPAIADILSSGPVSRKAHLELILAQRPQGAVIVLRPVVLAYVSDGHPDPRAHSLHDIAVPDVDPVVGNPWLIRVGKEDYVAWLQRVRVGDDRSILLTILIAGKMGKIEAEVPIHVLRKSAAIETARIGATPYIWRTDELHRERGHLISSCACL